MNEHEKLKAICEKIWYNFNWYDKFEWHHPSKMFYPWYNLERSWADFEWDTADVREIIFTQDFMNKMEHYYLRYVDEDCDDTHAIVEIMVWLGENLNTPVEFLYNLIK